MNLDVLSPNLLIYVCLIYAGLAYYLLPSLYHVLPEKKPVGKNQKAAFARKRNIIFGTHLLACIALAVIIFFICIHWTDTGIPASFILMCLPATTALGALSLAIFFQRRYQLLAVGLLFSGIVFSIVIINDYYRYFPTLGEVFGVTNTQSLKSGTNTVTLNFSVDSNQQKSNSATVQGTFSDISSAPTAGKLYQLSIPGTVSKFKPRSAYVYIPAIYFSAAQVNLPVIILTAGTPGTPDNWVGLGLESIMDQFARQHEGITPLVFVVDSTGTLTNDTECVNGPRGNVETYLTTDVPNYIKSHFNVDDSAKNWAIGGLSLGGMCAVMLTLRHPEVFNYFIDLGGEVGPEVGSEQATIDALFDGSISNYNNHQPSYLLTHHKYPQLGGFFADGAQDSLKVTQAISQLNTQSRAAGINTVIETINGAHTFNVWAQTYKDALPWISNRIGATQCSSACL